FDGLPHEMLYRKQHERAPHLAETAPDAPPDLAPFCDRLLDRDPARRPAAAEVLELLAGHRPAAGAPQSAPAEQRTILVGRESELAALTDALETARAGAGPVAVMVRGESGVGKSALVTAFVERQDTAGCIVLTARCYER